ncbi:MAG: helix-turn-helix domain-containing protein [Clostridiales Family XIII bacterium]|jgi:AraC-like DNA-binding protein|nr:helix-turn-helix domain-containing protein [Clostridiales Family XIII bacterium]
MKNNLYPVQPFFLVNTTKYYKIKLFDTPIVHFYSFAADDENTSRRIVVPDACVDVVFSETDEGLEGTVCGLVTKGDALPTLRGVKYFGVRFSPGFLPKRFGVTIPELVNNRVDLSQLHGGAELLEKMRNIQSFADRSRFMLKFIAGDWRTNELLQLMINAVCASGGETRVRDLEEITLYSSRYINRVFRDNMGISPKAFCEHVRFQQLISEMNSGGGKKIIDIAAEYGYYDQSHFTHEFKTFTTITPGSYGSAVDLPNYHSKFVYLPMEN